MNAKTQSRIDLLRALATSALAMDSVAEKLLLAERINSILPFVEDGDWNLPEVAGLVAAPGRPEQPQLVAPRALPRRGFSKLEHRVALIHALAHIEFNAIHLAWDALARFPDMPEDYYLDWAVVAFEEGLHFALLEGRLQALASFYGKLPAHDGLWDMAQRTRGSCLERMAIVPRVLEARGLDVTPGMKEKFIGVGDKDTASVLERIYRDEIRHVRIGDKWFKYCCAQQGIDAQNTFQDLIAKYVPGMVKGPFNTEARLEAGFSASELQRLAQRPSADT